jgi:pSer/pThr/pTyr-binding forkhead associated (FHA) protein
VILASVAISEVLLILKIAFLVLLYLFIWRIVRAASKEVRTPQESMILAPQQAAVLRAQAAADPAFAPELPEVGRLVVLRSPVLREAELHPLNGAPFDVGRGGQNDIVLDGDDFASARHARFEPRSDGVWIADLGSTNGTFVNGIRIARERKLSSGDIVRVGETEFRFEEPKR